MDERENLIRQRAYELWERDGKPEGQEMHFWLEAEREIDNGFDLHDHSSPQAS